MIFMTLLSSLVHGLMRLKKLVLSYICPCVFYSVLCLDILYVSDSVMYNCVTSMHSITVGYK